MSTYQSDKESLLEETPTAPVSSDKRWIGLAIAAMASTAMLVFALSSSQEVVAPDLSAPSSQALYAKKSKLPVCLFLHGALTKGARPTKFVTDYGEVMGSTRTYWGPYNIWFADVCETFLYSWAQTEDYTFTDSHLMNSYVDKASEVIDKGGIVIAHSMANAILAAACWKLDKCVRWYGLGGGFSGHIAGPEVLKLMDSTKDIKIPIGNTGDTIPAGFEFVDHFASRVIFNSYRLEEPGMRLANTNRNALQKLVDEKKLMKGSVCGTRPHGNLQSLRDYTSDGSYWGEIFKLERYKDQFLLGSFMKFVGSLVTKGLTSTGHSDTRGDGLVELNTCAFWSDHVSEPSQKHWMFTDNEVWPEYDFDETPPADERYILAKINHAEECGVAPEAGSHVALAWMRNMMCNEIFETQGGSTCASAPESYEWPRPKGRVGDICLLNTDCQDFVNKGLFDYSANTKCCQWEGHGVCQKLLMDWEGNYECPSKCVGDPYQKSPDGTCDEEFALPYPRASGQMCKSHKDCQGYTRSSTQSGYNCCKGECTRKQKGFDDRYRCPHLCKSQWYHVSGGSC